MKIKRHGAARARPRGCRHPAAGCLRHRQQLDPPPLRRPAAAAPLRRRRPSSARPAGDPHARRLDRAGRTRSACGPRTTRTSAAASTSTTAASAPVPVSPSSTSGTVDLAGSDFPLSATDQPKADARCKTGPAINIPLVPGPIAVGYNLPERDHAEPLRRHAGEDLQRQDHELERPGDRQGQLRRQAAQPAASRPSTGRTARAPATTSPTTWPTRPSPTWTYGANKNWPAPGGQGDKGSALVARTSRPPPAASATSSCPTRRSSRSPTPR